MLVKRNFTKKHNRKALKLRKQYEEIIKDIIEHANQIPINLTAA